MCVSAPGVRTSRRSACRRRRRCSWRRIICAAITAWISHASLAVGQELQPEQVASKDFYEVLGVGKAASEHDVKKAYRKLAQQSHPDKAPADKKEEASRHFAEIAEAYEVLRSDDKRREYDAIRAEYLASSASGHSGSSGGSGGWRPSHDFDDSMWDFRDPFELFQEQFQDPFFGGGWSGGGRSPLDDLFDVSLGGGMFGSDGGGSGGGSGGFFDGNGGGGMSGTGGGTGGGAGGGVAGGEDSMGANGGSSSGGGGSGHDEYTEQSFDQIEDFVGAEGQMLRRWTCTIVLPDGRYQSTAREYQLLPDGRFMQLGPAYFVPPESAGFFGGRKAGGRTRRVDHVLRVNERLLPGAQLASPDGKFIGELDSSCNFRVEATKKVGGFMGVGSGRRDVIWETATYSPAGRCFMVLQGNGNVMIATLGWGPDEIDGVLYNSNKKSMPPFDLERGSDYYAIITSGDGNFVVSQGEDPQDAASACVWAALGCPEDGPIPWRKLYRLLSRWARGTYCTLVGCDDYEDTGVGGGGVGGGGSVVPPEEEEEVGIMGMLADWGRRLKRTFSKSKKRKGGAA